MNGWLSYARSVQTEAVFAKKYRSMSVEAVVDRKYYW